MYDVLYRRGLTPWVAAGHAQSALIERLLDREESWHGAAAGRTLVDLGCGTGEHSLAAATRGWTVVGIDASAVAIDRARRAAAASGLDVRFVAGDVRRLTDVPGLRPGVSVFVDVGCHHGLRPPPIGGWWPTAWRGWRRPGLRCSWSGWIGVPAWSVSG